MSDFVLNFNALSELQMSFSLNEEGIEKGKYLVFFTESQEG